MVSLLAFFILVSVSSAALFTINYPDGGVYVGELSTELDSRDGRGTMTYLTGDVYIGMWRDNINNGYGEITYKSGNVYKGNWVDGKHTGYGTKYWSQGPIYAGEWEEDVIQGHGIFTYANGDTHEGEWWQNMRHGPGVHRNAQNEILEEGIWDQDVLFHESMMDEVEEDYKEVIPPLVMDEVISEKPTVAATKRGFFSGLFGGK